MFRFPRVLTMENGTDPKSEKSIRSDIKFATKAVKTPYLYVNSIKSYGRKTVYFIFHGQNTWKTEHVFNMTLVFGDFFHEKNNFFNNVCNLKPSPNSGLR